jgi:Tol biopolymer transport system component
MNTNGSDMVRLTDVSVSGGALDAWPRWSPDGTRIAFVEYPIRSFGPDEIREMNADGSANTFVTEGDYGRLAWSPDSDRLAYTLGGDNPTDRTEVYSVNVNVSAPTDLTNNPASDSNGD